ncbi:hypothetical protein B566_EDAN009333 [Ephemera danica]|nr:hypothetical protein B566_EDAN009333 [Ephemera danica]
MVGRCKNSRQESRESIARRTPSRATSIRQDARTSQVSMKQSQWNTRKLMYDARNVSHQNATDSMTTASHPPIPEFRDAEHYRGPLSDHDIIRPKPRRPGEVHRAACEPPRLSLAPSPPSLQQQAQPQQPASLQLATTPARSTCTAEPQAPSKPRSDLQSTPVPTKYTPTRDLTQTGVRHKAAPLLDLQCTVSPLVAGGWPRLAGLLCLTRGRGHLVLVSRHAHHGYVKFAYQVTRILYSHTVQVHTYDMVVVLCTCLETSVNLSTSVGAEEPVWLVALLGPGGRASEANTTIMNNNCWVALATAQNAVRSCLSVSTPRAMPQQQPQQQTPTGAALLRSPSKDRLQQSASASPAWADYTTAAPQRPSPAALVVYKASSREVAPVPRQSPLRAPSRPVATPTSTSVLQGKATPPLTEWTPTDTTSTGLSKLELCQFYNVQQFPERDVPHDKPTAVPVTASTPLSPVQHDKSAASPEHEATSSPNTKVDTEAAVTATSAAQCSAVAAAAMRAKRPAAKLKSRRRNILSFPHHLSVDELRLLQRRQDSCGGSSSDENRSSGHASMSDGHTSSSSPPADSLGRRHQHYRSPLGAVPEDERLSASVMLLQGHQGSRVSNMGGTRKMTATSQQPLRSRHRATPAKLESGGGGGGLEDIRLAIEQLTLRSHGSRASYSTSTYSSVSGSESEPVRRLIRHSLVELQQLPWSNHDVLRVIQQGRAREHLGRVSMETVPRLAYLLQRALVRVAREAQRLARPLGMCSKHEVASALRIVLSPALADSCTKACLRAAAMFAVSGDQLRQSKSARAGLQLCVGRFHRWMSDVRLGKFIHEYAAVYLAAGLENLLEEVVLQCLPPEEGAMLTAPLFEHAIASNGDLWGLLQPYAHLNAGRTATGALSMPRWPSAASLSSSCGAAAATEQETGSQQSIGKTLEQCLLTTCVGSAAELSELLGRVSLHVTRSTARAPPLWTPSALHALFYFMRCSQASNLEHAEHAEGAIQELVYERPYAVLPPLTEWARVAAAHAEHRRAPALDRDDVLQAARLLLPGVDCPVRLVGYEEVLCPRRPSADEGECVRKFKTDLAFKMLSCGRTDLIPHALQLLPSSKVNTVNEQGLTPLMVACVHGDEASVRLLLDAGADVDTETPGARQGGASDETQHWTALTYAALQGHVGVARLLLERGANVEGGARLSEDRCTETPLQVAAAAGNLDMVALFAISVAAAHGQRATLHHLINHHPVAVTKEVLSLEEILAEGASGQGCTAERHCERGVTTGTGTQQQTRLDAEGALKFSKTQIKALQEAMYHSAENNHLGGFIFYET